jgi:hypothetical protein
VGQKNCIHMINGLVTLYFYFIFYSKYKRIRRQLNRLKKKKRKEMKGNEEDDNFLRIISHSYTPI